MYFTIENHDLRVIIDSLGCELCSIFDKQCNREMLWQADKNIWPKHGPVLFPVIGRMRHKQYEHDQQTYNIEPHGFARVMAFEIAQIDDTSAAFVLRSNSRTRKVYPFLFELTISFRLNGKKLIKTHKVQNNSAKEMLFEIGGHEGYNVAFSQDELMDDYSLGFGKKETLSYNLDENMLVSKPKIQMPLKGGRLYLDNESFFLDTFIVSHQLGENVILYNHKGKPMLRVHAGDFQYIAVWTKKLEKGSSRFVCIEPWTSLPDCNFVGSKLADKVNVQRLYAGESRTYSYMIEVI